MHHVIYIYAYGVCAVCVSRFFDILQLTVAGVHASTPVFERSRGPSIDNEGCIPSLFSGRGPF
jgi:hypothetical protein